MIDKILGTRTTVQNPVVTEHALSINAFNKPLVSTNQDAIAIKLIELMLLRPGTYPTRPNMGVGLVEKYRYVFTDDIGILQSEIEDQIRTYLPDFQTVTVELRVDEYNKNLYLYITINDTTYALVLDTDTKTLSIL